MPTVPVRVSSRPHLVALTEFLRHPAMVGSAFPASGRMVEKVLAPLDWSDIGVLVEFGPGTGRFTQAALRRMAPKARLLAIDTSRQFVDQLKATIVDERLVVVNGSAEDVGLFMAQHGLGTADCILSGLPFSTLPGAQADEIVEASCDVLSETGVFAAYQMRRAVEPLLHRHFRSIVTGFEWLNIPPCHLYWASGAIAGAYDISPRVALACA